MSDTSRTLDSTAVSAKAASSHAGIALGLALLSPIVLVIVALLEYSMSGTQFLMGRVSEPSPLILRLLGLLPLWACIAAVFYFGLRNKDEASSSMVMVIAALVLALGSAFCGLFVSGYALFP